MRLQSSLDFLYSGFTILIFVMATNHFLVPGIHATTNPYPDWKQPKIYQDPGDIFTAASQHNCRSHAILIDSEGSGDNLQLKFIPDSDASSKLSGFYLQRHHNIDFCHSY